LERDRRDRIFAARYVQELAGQRTFTASKLEDALSRKQMHELPERVRPPSHPIVSNRVAVT